MTLARNYLFKTRLGAVMQERGLTAYGLHKLINKKSIFENINEVSYETLYGYFNESLGEDLDGNVIEPSIQNIVQIAVALDISLYDLLGLNWVDLLYSDPRDRTARSVLVHLYILSTLYGVEVSLNTDQTTIIYSNDTDINKFLNNVDFNNDDESETYLMISKLNFSDELYKTYLHNYQSVNKGLDIKKTVHDRLRELLIVDAGLKYAQVAEILNFKTNTVTKQLTEHEYSMPSINHLLQYAFIFNIDIHYLIGLSDIKQPFITPQHKLITMVNLYKLLKSCNFKPLKNNETVQMISSNQYIYKFFEYRNRMHNLKDAYRIASLLCENNLLWIVNNEIIQYDKFFEEDPERFLIFLLNNNLYHSDKLSDLQLNYLKKIYDQNRENN